MAALACFGCGDSGPVTAGSGADDGLPHAADVSADAVGTADTADAVGPEPWELRVLSFNVLCSFCDPGADYHDWETRLGWFADVFERHAPDLMGLQELSFPDEVDQIQALDPDGGWAALFFDEGTELPNPDATILYREARFDLLDQGFYWLSPTPDEPWSRGFTDEQVLPRVVAWARLHDTHAGRELVFVNTHFDANTPAQQPSAELLLAQTAPIAEDTPVIVTGDFNTHPGELAYGTLTTASGFHLEDSYDLAEAPTVASNLDPVPAWEPTGRIDHIFAAGEIWRCDEWVVDLQAYGADSLFPSDHYPVFARLVVP